ncbi:MAG: helix-turn-helix transcriptional regulator [Rhodopirellula sp.]|nr:helix-turn-helix transcriptional regulator [Rhodopirellula sp.]
MPRGVVQKSNRLTGHALRNANLCQRSLKRSKDAPPLARKAVEVRVSDLQMTRIELARQSGISRGALRDLELGIHTPTRNTLERFIEFSDEAGVPEERLDELRDLYAGPADSMENVIARLELKAGSSPRLAKKVGVSAATLWEYRRGNFPVPHEILRKMCKTLKVDFETVEPVWQDSERDRFLQRGFPQSMAEFCMLRLRAGHAESDLLELGLGTAQLRRLCYLELLPWARIASVAKSMCRNDDEIRHLRDLWQEDYRRQKDEGLHAFGLRLKKMREQQGITRREMSDLFLVGGKKPARIIKHIEEDGHYSQQAFPAGLIALLTDPMASEGDDAKSKSSESGDQSTDLVQSGNSVSKNGRPAVPVNGTPVGSAETASRNGTAIVDRTEAARAAAANRLEIEESLELRKLWEQRRIRFHLRHRPEMQLDLRLQREFFGFDVNDAARILGYTSLEYQKIERGIEQLSDSARSRILDALSQAGNQKVGEIFQRRSKRDTKRVAWKSPGSVSEMIRLLAIREGGLVPLSRKLRDAELAGISPPRLRAYLQEEETPSWSLLHGIAESCGVRKLGEVHINWIHRYREQLKQKSNSLLAVELRLLIAEVAPTLRAFAKRLPFNYSVLLRDLYRVEGQEPIKWPHIERLLRAAGLPSSSERWRVIQRLWEAQN